jgi:hypothetical protein
MLDMAGQQNTLKSRHTTGRLKIESVESLHLLDLRLQIGHGKPIAIYDSRGTDPIGIAASQPDSESNSNRHEGKAAQARHGTVILT